MRLFGGKAGLNQFALHPRTLSRIPRKGKGKA